MLYCHKMNGGIHEKSQYLYANTLLKIRPGFVELGWQKDSYLHEVPHTSLPAVSSLAAVRKP